MGDMALMAFTVLVCGGRDYKDRDKVFEVLDRLHIGMRIDAIVHGAARGADHLAGAWAFTRRVAQKRFPADWVAHGKAAGPIRNRTMLWATKPDLVVAFPGGRGTLHMIDVAKRAKVPVMEVLRDGSVIRAGGGDQDRPAGVQSDAPAGEPV
jgi:hypothetical protein